MKAKSGHFLSFFSNKIAALVLYGTIGKRGDDGLSLDSLNDNIEKAFSIKGLRAVFLLINSPGGSPVQSELIASKIRLLADKKNVIVYSFIEDLGASGGYWLACAGDKIFATKNSIVGSIGVISSSFGLDKAISKLGIERRTYTQGKNKSLLDPFLPENDEGKKMIKRIQEKIHNSFINYVKNRRGGKLSNNKTELFDGSVWTGEEAKELGLIDDIKDFFSFKEENFPQNTTIKFIKKKESWIKKKLGADFSFLSSLIEIFCRLFSNKTIQ